MWDIKIACEYCPEIIDILKAFFISNDIPYEVRDDNVVFFADTVNKFFDVAKNMNKFYDAHKPKGYCDYNFSIECDTEDYALRPIRYGEW